MRSAMSKPTLDADTILKRAAPVTGQHAQEIQPFGHLVRMPIAARVMASQGATALFIPTNNGLPPAAQRLTEELIVADLEVSAPEQMAMR